MRAVRKGETKRKIFSRLRLQKVNTPLTLMQIKEILLSFLYFKIRKARKVAPKW